MKADTTEISYLIINKLFFIHSTSWYKCFSVNIIQSIMQLFLYMGTTNSV